MVEKEHHNVHHIAFDQLGLASILKQNQLAVPSNQRNYKWDEREVTQLFQDLARARDSGDYFLGTIVVIPRENGILELVDGQQRLATIAILLAAIRNYLKGKEDVIVESINNEFLTGIDRSKRKRLPKLQLNLDDNELFSCIITGEGDISAVAKESRESHRLLLQTRDLAAKHIANVVSTFDKKDHGDVLDGWISFLEDQALVVLLRVPNSADAFRMFETLNDRGVRTNQADLVKNFLFGRSAGHFSEVQNRWSYMRGALESMSDEDNTIDFLRHALIVQGGDLTEAAVYERVQSIVKSDEGALAFATMLENLSNVYVATFNPEHERWTDYPDSVRRAIHIFSLFDIKPMRPLILAVAARMDTKETARSFRFLVSLGVRLLIASTTRSGGVSTPLANIANEIYKGNIKDAGNLKKGLAAVTPSDSDFEEAFAKARVSNAAFARYYLRALEMTAKDEKEPWYGPIEDKAVITLEHILPRKPEDKWPQFGEDDAANCVNRLGNMALLQKTPNSDLRSEPFNAKKVVYAQSPYILTSELAEFEDWTPETIAHRQKKIAELCVKTWPV